MKKKLSFNIKIIIIFIMPTVALLYFSFKFVEVKYEKINSSSTYKLAAEVTDSLSNILHNLQIERGLSSGFIVVTTNRLTKNTLKQHHKITDISVVNFLEYMAIESDEKRSIKQRIENKNTPIIKDILHQLSTIGKIREKILNRTIDFNMEIKFYNELNAKIIDSIRLLATILRNQSNDNGSLVMLHQLKESAGQERAYTYNQLVSNIYHSDHRTIIQKLILQQRNSRKLFELMASQNSTDIYKKYIKNSRERAIDFEFFRERFLNAELDSTYANEWFKISSARINTLGEISADILEHYKVVSIKDHKEAINALYFTALLWILLIVSLIILAMILRKLINKEAQLAKDLRIASYSFDSHEAMTITDTNGIIVKVNKAFTKITGYTAQEVIGKNPRILKSTQHSKQFYKDMWAKLYKDGNWSGEIYNKRKNGEIFPERLSITAIKNEDDETTHYIAQFLDLSEIEKAKYEAIYQANHDFLTGLANRKFLMQRFQEEFSRATRYNYSYAFLFIDLDGFKDVNDKHGHEAGDLLLIDVANRLKDILRTEDLVARIGGDEFAIMVLNPDTNHAHSSKHSTKICTKVLNELNRSFEIDGHTITISGSIGIKLFPVPDEEISDVMKNADSAMYLAKQSGKNQCVLFDET